jgi:hypothetical protein
MKSEWFTTDQVRQLVELLTVVAAAPDTSDEHRYELDYCRSQVAQQMPAVESSCWPECCAKPPTGPGPTSPPATTAVGGAPISSTY